MGKVELHRAYTKGYNAGSRKAWPDHRPIKPPDEITGRLVEALQNLRDAVDNELAKFAEEDELQTTLGLLVDEADRALTLLGQWEKAI